MVLPFKWNLFSSTFTSYYLFGIQFLQTSIINKIIYEIHIHTFGGGHIQAAHNRIFFGSQVDGL